MPTLPRFVTNALAKNGSPAMKARGSRFRSLASPASSTTPRRRTGGRWRKSDSSLSASASVPARAATTDDSMSRTKSAKGWVGSQRCLTSTRVPSSDSSVFTVNEIQMPSRS